MPILAQLTRLYESRGIEISTGLNPSHFGDHPYAPFTWFIRDGKSVTEGLGISLQEIYFLECLFEHFQPRRLFVIGNSAGWSTLALALLNPGGQVLAIDAGFDTSSLEGIDLTNRIAAEEALPAQAVKGVSPADVGRLIGEHDMAPVDFAFIDGYHTVEQVELDFEAIRPHATPGCVYLFHDVQNFGLHPALDRAAGRGGLVWELLLGTSSGMGIMYHPAHPPPCLDDIAAFKARPAAVEILKRAAWARKHRHLARWQRSFRKRFGGASA